MANAFVFFVLYQARVIQDLSLIIWAALELEPDLVYLIWTDEPSDSWL